MERFMPLFMSSVLLITGIIFLKFSDKIAKALDASDVVFWKSLNLFKQTPQSYIVIKKMFIFITGLLFLIVGVLFFLMFLSSILSKK